MLPHLPASRCRYHPCCNRHAAAAAAAASASRAPMQARCLGCLLRLLPLQRSPLLPAEWCQCLLPRLLAGCSRLGSSCSVGCQLPRHFPPSLLLLLRCWCSKTCQARIPPPHAAGPHPHVLPVLLNLLLSGGLSSREGCPTFCIPLAEGLQHIRCTTSTSSNSNSATSSTPSAGEQSHER
jgi:hypothetical protein